MTLSNPIQASLLRCAAAGISVYSPHSALDSVHDGINDWLASGLGRGRVDFIGDEHPSGRGGQGRLLKLDEKTTLSNLQERVKKHLCLTQCLYHTHTLLSLDFIKLRCLCTVQVALGTDNPNNEIHSVAICAGSGGSMLLGVEADVYFTGEMSHVRLPEDHEVLGSTYIYMHSMKFLPLSHLEGTSYCVSPRIALFEEKFSGVPLGGHTNTERGYLPVLASKLRAELDGEGKRFGAASVHISQEDRHPLDFV